ncbi:hypothetical protein [Fluviispira sanaruensis]|uniref:Uncharacterized protein n=1 Tax=Fluviispira sanaruensis TaxID=2493639 RepID=A0A4P2VN65_FLUSA|nr:hypothetical protein [Fluviispira sanaruensis]BBH54481.1 hypothetical protein JCM31447_29520 [Fluviispira sanaruensis]
MKKSTLKLGLCLLTSLYASQSFANDQTEAQKLNHYAIVDQYSDESQDFSVVEGVRASLSKETEHVKENNKEPNKKLRKSGFENSVESGGDKFENEVIFEKEGLKVYNEKSSSLSQNSSLKTSMHALGDNQDKKKGYRVVINNKTKKVGVLSEKIIVKANNNFKLSSKLKHKDYPQIGYYIVDIPENAKISDVIKEIREENISSIESIKVEVIENFTKKPL